MADSSATAAWVPVLTFHTLGAGKSPIEWLPQAFRRAMAKLRDNGYRAIGLMEALSYLRGGARFPRRSFVLTFDDGYESVYLQAFPALQEHKMPATIFLTVGSEGRAGGERLPSLNAHPMLTWAQILEMARHGVAFGAHTLTHPDLTRLTPERVEMELSGSKTVLEDALGASVDCFAYPYGFYNGRVQAIAREHFALALTDGIDLLHTGSDAYAAERVDAYYLRDARLFGLMLTGLFPWYVHGRGALMRVRRAVLSSVGK